MLFLVQCNNPLTKEPKLDAARRIVPEWVDYDSEIMALWEIKSLIPHLRNNLNTPTILNFNMYIV